MPHNQNVRLRWFSYSKQYAEIRAKKKNIIFSCGLKNGRSFLQDLQLRQRKDFLGTQFSHQEVAISRQIKLLQRPVWSVNRNSMNYNSVHSTKSECLVNMKLGISNSHFCIRKQDTHSMSGFQFHGSRIINEAYMS